MVSTTAFVNSIDFVDLEDVFSDGAKSIDISQSYHEQTSLPVTAPYDSVPVYQAWENQEDPLASSTSNEHEDLHTPQRLFPTPTIKKVTQEMPGTISGVDYSPGAYCWRGHHRSVCRCHTQYENGTSFSPDRSGDQALWTSERERVAGIKDATSHIRAKFTPAYFIYGIQYKPTVADDNIFRSLLIQGIPYGVSLSNILQHVRGGPVFSATMIAATLSKSNGTVFLVFLESHDASTYVEFRKESPLLFAVEDSLLEATVALVESPTYPIAATLGKSIRIRGHTRHIVISLDTLPAHWCIEDTSKHLQDLMKARDETIVEIWTISDLLHVEFSSIQSASSAFLNMRRSNDLKETEIRFEIDTCAFPIEELSDLDMIHVEDEQHEDVAINGPDSDLSSSSSTIRPVSRSGIAGAGVIVDADSNRAGSSLVSPETDYSSSNVAGEGESPHPALVIKTDEQAHPARVEDTLAEHDQQNQLSSRVDERSSGLQTPIWEMAEDTRVVEMMSLPAATRSLNVGKTNRAWRKAMGCFFRVKTIFKKLSKLF